MVQTMGGAGQLPCFFGNVSFLCDPVWDCAAAFGGYSVRPSQKIYFMNALGFLLRRLTWQFGMRGERDRWACVTRETQILSEAQDLLGRLAWRDVAKIDDVTGEYWQLMDLDKQQQKLRDESTAILARIDTLTEQLNGIEDKYEDKIDDLRDQKDAVLEEAAKVSAHMNEVQGEDMATRERFASLKNKLDVLKRQEGVDLSAEIEKTRLALVQLKAQHEELKKEIEAKEKEVASIEKSVQGVDGEIARQRQEMKDESADLVTEIGKLSKQIAELSAKIGSVENMKTDLSFKVGVYLCNNAEDDRPEIREVIGSYRQLVSKILYLRRSIQYNQRLARRGRD